MIPLQEMAALSSIFNDSENTVEKKKDNDAKIVAETNQEIHEMHITAADLGGGEGRG